VARTATGNVFREVIRVQWTLVSFYAIKLYFETYNAYHKMNLLIVSVKM
jgi:hypothetical protein